MNVVPEKIQIQGLFQKSLKTKYIIKGFQEIRKMGKKSTKQGSSIKSADLGKVTQSQQKTGTSRTCVPN